MLICYLRKNDYYDPPQNVEKTLDETVQDKLPIVNLYQSMCYLLFETQTISVTSEFRLLLERC